MSILFIALGILWFGYIFWIAGIIGWSLFLYLLGPGVSFVLIAIGALFIYRRFHPFQIPFKIMLPVMVLIGILTLIFAVVEGRIIYYAYSQPERNADYMIVLGAKVNGEELSNMLRKRLEKTYEYAKENPETRIIVSGGQGPGENISEAEAMARYLIERGISSERIIKEEKSTSTNENIIFSKVFIDSEDAKVVVVTNGFHILRGIHICEKNGLTSVSGASAPTTAGFHVYSYVREAIAYMKDYVFGNI